MAGRVIRVAAEDLAVRVRFPAQPSALVPGVTLPERTVWLSACDLRDVEIEIVERPGPGPSVARALPLRRARVLRSAG